MEFNVLLTIVLSSFGGTAIALIGLTKFLGGIVSKRIEQKEKLVLDKQLENLGGNHHAIVCVRRLRIHLRSRHRRSRSGH